jgi:hypothetical protein
MSNIERPDWGPGGESRSVTAETSNANPAGDWGDGKHQRYDVVPSVDSPDILAEMRSYPNAPSAQPSEGGLVAGLTSTQAEAANFVLEQITSENPELLVLEDDIAELSEGTRAAIGRALARKPHARRDALLRAFADEFTLEQAVEFKKWHVSLPGPKRDLLSEWADG